eukprot:CAMPEP_0197005746 /NCGR_PEP_ID=MMETSP1380-20130617/31077_1 /TAXON_ID=5936 /ORGANISM="Euplotes crassus, Strain CT5" /LENGTH=151 /DNA_ID=CAMNT_0042425001 /DNA_START=40 /DNA_END=495 /DNA_ORIENTATION=+
MAQNYVCSSRPLRAVMDSEEVAERLQIPPPQGQDYFFIHVSSYPNNRPNFYSSVWYVLNGHDGLQAPLTWFYIRDQTQDYFCPQAMTEEQATNMRHAIKGRMDILANHLLLKGAHGGKKNVPSFSINVLMTKAFKYDIYQYLEGVAGLFDP